MSKEVYIIGDIRTNNFTDENLFDKIGSLWNKMNDFNIENDIKYGVYHQYTSNYRGDYTLTIATETPVSNEKIIIPENEYKVFECLQDEHSISETWKKIWQLEDEKKLNRAYSLDYEKYYPDGKVEIHIAIK
ncbi:MULTISPECIES: GyrI-like domain-containing protein [unclassified Peribacillus]|uniref:GyrI-like domain-containing protein n=1 Tax=unclassified Peribacillus TaxID=2675266 RepID=UPI001913D53C|nr:MULTISPECIES: GyrI-like domain-containing protein [unclassified Peribacillus]MBK5441571.1 GyrI-like domain-containing protein [Peribacillus sp. TH24]WMX58165.1 GyrI-like domain-containing protein [Peribacillus sp. R9-11]